jgi:hypothetical protein
MEKAIDLDEICVKFFREEWNRQEEMYRTRKYKRLPFEYLRDNGCNTWASLRVEVDMILGKTSPHPVLTRGKMFNFYMLVMGKAQIELNKIKDEEDADIEQ